ncbi:MAG: WD40 repeat domain-containing protein [Cyanobacteria bacterium P01_G01_bin.39]
MNSCTVKFNQEGNLVATGYIERDGFIDANFVKAWNLKDKKQEFSLSGHEPTIWGRIQTVCFSPKESILASAGIDKTIKIWDTVGKGERGKLIGHSSKINSIVISPDGKKLISADAKGVIKIWNIRTSKLLKSVEAHLLPIRCLSVISNPSQDIFASSSDDYTIKLWKVTDGSLISTLSGHNDSVNSIAFGTDGKILVSGSDDQTIKIWDIESSDCLTTLNNEDSATAIALKPDGEILVSGSQNGYIKIWQRENK